MGYLIWYATRPNLLLGKQPCLVHTFHHMTQNFAVCSWGFKCYYLFDVPLITSHMSSMCKDASWNSQ